MRSSQSRGGRARSLCRGGRAPPRFPDRARGSPRRRRNRTRAAFSDLSGGNLSRWRGTGAWAGSIAPRRVIPAENVDWGIVARGHVLHDGGDAALEVGELAVGKAD